MTLNPNKYRLAYPTIVKLWEQGKNKEDFERVATEIAVNSHIEIASICLIIQHQCKEDRLIPLFNQVVEFYKYDNIIPVED